MATRKRKDPQEPASGAPAPKKTPAAAPKKKKATAATPSVVSGLDGGAESQTAPQYWLVKNEPDELSIQNIRDFPARTLPDGTHMAAQTMYWDGVRNFQARNFMKAMKVGDVCLMYHSNCQPPGIVGTLRVVRDAYPDHHALDPKSKYYDAKSTPGDVRFVMVDVAFVELYPRMITLAELRQHQATGPLASLHTLRIGRLSVSPVTPAEYSFIDGLAHKA